MSSVEEASNEKKRVTSILLETLKTRFECFNVPVFANMVWMDPRNWVINESLIYGNDMIDYLYNHFKVPLIYAGFDKSKVINEWKRFRFFVKCQFAKDFSEEKEKCASKVWMYILRFKKKEFFNLSLIAEVVLSIAGSNSAVERMFSILRLILSDRRSKLKHGTMTMLMCIGCNDKFWTEIKREAIKK